MIKNDANRRRRGSVIVPALVCLMLVTLLGGVLLRQAATHRGLVRSGERQLQAEWLVESGLARARAYLARDRAYDGETWEITAAELHRPDSAQIVIKITPVDQQPNQRRVSVRADYPRGASKRIRESRSVTVDLGPETPGGSS